MDTCAGNFAEGFPQGSYTQGIVAFKSQKDDLSCATVTPDEIEGVSSNFGCGRVTASAGDYKLCFCTPRGGVQCEATFDFGFEIGLLTLEGPFSGQPRKCTQNQRCAVDFISGVASVCSTCFFGLVLTRGYTSVCFANRSASAEIQLQGWFERW